MTIPRIHEYRLPAPAVWPSNKVDWDIIKNKAVLLVHDMQRYFVNFYSENDASLKEVTQNIATLIMIARQNGVPVIYTAQRGNQEKSARGLLYDFWGSGISEHDTPIVESLAPHTSDEIFIKHRYSAFFGNGLLDYMHNQQRSQILICGIYAHIGCTLTAADAFMHNVQPFLVGDAIYDFSRDAHIRALDYVASICGKLVTTETAKAELILG